MAPPGSKATRVEVSTGRLGARIVIVGHLNQFVAENEQVPGTSDAAINDRHSGTNILS
jgi:hypothetical protein